VSPGLEHAAYLGLAGFVLIVAFGAVLLTTNALLSWLARTTQRLLNSIPKRKSTTKDLPERLIAERNLVRSNLGRRWREAVLLIGGRIGFDYFALLCALRATGANPNAHWSSWPTPRPPSSPWCHSPPADSASSKRVSADSSS